VGVSRTEGVDTSSKMWQPPAHYPYPPYPPGMAHGAAAGGSYPNFGYPYPYMYPHPGMAAKPADPLKKKRGRPSKRKKRNKQAKAEVRLARHCLVRQLADTITFLVPRHGGGVRLAGAALAILAASSPELTVGQSNFGYVGGIFT